MKPIFTNGFVSWSEEEILIRRHVEESLVCKVRNALTQINRAINVHQIETPCLIPPSYGSHGLQYSVDSRYVLRAESTAGTYAVFDKTQLSLPVCLYQVNKSFRDESSDAMRLSKFRLREFWQLEFQLFYSPDTKVDYHEAFLANFNPSPGVFVPVADNLPTYSERTTDIEIGDVEVASLSSRRDFRLPVFEMSFGLDRYVILHTGLSV